MQIVSEMYKPIKFQKDPKIQGKYYFHLPRVNFTDNPEISNALKLLPAIKSMKIERLEKPIHIGDLIAYCVIEVDIENIKPRVELMVNLVQKYFTDKIFLPEFEETMIYLWNQSRVIEMIPNLVLLE